MGSKSDEELMASVRETHQVALCGDGTVELYIEADGRRTERQSLTKAELHNRINAYPKLVAALERVETILAHNQPSAQAAKNLARAHELAEAALNKVKGGE